MGCVIDSTGREFKMVGCDFGICLPILVSAPRGDAGNAQACIPGWLMRDARLLSAML